MTKDLSRRLDRLERAAGTNGPALQLFFEPRPCADPAAFAQQCEREAAEAGAQQAIIVRFVSPADIAPHGPLQ